MLFNLNFASISKFCQFFHVIQWVFQIFFIFLSIFYVIQWEFCISSIFHVIQWEHEAQKLWRGGAGTGRTDGSVSDSETMSQY